VEFEITLTAKSTDEGGILASFNRQLAELGGENTLLDETKPFRVNGSQESWFEASRTYRIVLS
jgi:hypothetical protein